MTTNVPIQYPLFLEFTHQVKDVYWKLLYEDMAFGRFPSGVYIQKDYFCCIHKGKEFSIELSDANTQPLYLFQQIHGLLQSKMGIQSEKEKNRLKEKMIHQQTLKDETQKRMIKDSTLTSFVLREGQRYNLSFSLIRKLFSLLIIGFMFRTILSKDVQFEGNEIQAIQGFTFSEKKVRLTKNVYYIKKSTLQTEGEKPDSQSLSSNWSKYLQSIQILTPP